MKAAVPLKAPMPYAGGKSRVADMVWQRLGNVENYVEPFMGSLAVLLRRPAEHFGNGYRVETANDLNHYIVNLWRSIKADPEKVAEYADNPVTEADLHARHKWLVRSQEVASWRDRMRTDPECYDAKIAGWYLWGACCWIGGAWCHDGFVDRNMQPAMSQAGWGVNAGGPTDWEQVPKPSSSDGVDSIGGPTDWEQPPEVDGRGRHGRPQLADAFDIGRGVNASAKMPRLTGMRRGDLYYPGIGVNNIDLGGEGTCAARRAWLVDWMQRLSDRLRLVRTCYGHWSRICDSESTLTRLGTTGVFLDPPYPVKTKDGKKSRDGDLYATDKHSDLDALRDEVLAWCQKWGSHPDIRISVCGYEGDGYESLGWEEVKWSASGGYGNQRKGKGKSENADRERIWFSPACVPTAPPPDLFAGC